MHDPLLQFVDIPHKTTGVYGKLILCAHNRSVYIYVKNRNNRCRLVYEVEISVIYIYYILLSFTTDIIRLL